MTAKTITINLDDLPLGEMRRQDQEAIERYASAVERSGRYVAADLIRFIGKQIEEQLPEPLEAGYYILELKDTLTGREAVRYFDGKDWYLSKGGSMSCTNESHALSVRRLEEAA